MSDVRPFFRKAFDQALKSPDLSTQNGAVVTLFGAVVGQGYNSMPLNVGVTPERLERPAKYLFTEHAERAALYSASRSGVRPDEMYVLWGVCADCARAAIEFEIKTIHTHSFYGKHSRWDDSISAAHEMLTEAGVEVVAHDTQIMNDGESLRFNGSPIHY